MIKRMSREQLALQARIDEILWFDWDPIGVSDEPAARREYEPYVLGILGLALNRSDADEIARVFTRSKRKTWSCPAI
jgi:hypothetical protein